MADALFIYRSTRSLFLTLCKAVVLFRRSAENKMNLEDTDASVYGNKHRALLVTKKLMSTAEVSFQGYVMAHCGPYQVINPAC